MSESIWQKTSQSPGRLYMLGHEPYVKYDDQEEIIEKIRAEITKYLHIEPSVRLTLDGELTNAERATIAIPFDSDNAHLIKNLARTLYQTLIGYYLSAEPKTSHFGIANLNLEGKFNSLLKRETEKLLAQIQERADIAGRASQEVEITGKKEIPEPGNLYLADTVRKGLDIHIGYRIFMAGADVNYKAIFVPLPTGKEIIERIYYNLEQILQHNFITYDETNERHLKISETLIFKELEDILKRAKTKAFTRDKILNNLQANTISNPATIEENVTRKGDDLYDFLNNIQDTKLKAATEDARNLFTSYIQEMNNTFIEFTEKVAIGQDAVEEDSSETEKETEIRPTRMTREQYMASTNPRQGVSRPNRMPSRRNPVRVESRQDTSTQVPTPANEPVRVPEPKNESKDKEPVPTA